MFDAFPKSREVGEKYLDTVTPWQVCFFVEEGMKGIDMGVEPKIGGKPLNYPFVHRVFQYKPSILGYPCFWKHPYSNIGPSFFGEVILSHLI